MRETTERFAHSGLRALLGPMARKILKRTGVVHAGSDGEPTREDRERDLDHLERGLRRDPLREAEQRRERVIEAARLDREVMRLTALRRRLSAARAKADAWRRRRQEGELA